MTFAAPTADLLGLDDKWPRPGWAVLDAARSSAFSGEIELETFPRLRVYLDRGVIYLAERVSDPPIGVRLVEAGVLTAAELEQGSIRIGDTEHLGRLFDRAPSVDRHSVMVALELLNDEATTWAANQLVRGVAFTGYRHHVSAVHRWHRDRSWAPGSTVAQPLPPPAPDAVASPGPAPWLHLGDVEQLDDDVRIEWAESSWLGERPKVAPRPPVAPFAPPPVAVEIDRPTHIREAVAIAVDPDARDEDAVTGREVGDAFELIWPTGEIDEQFLGGPLSAMPPPGSPFTAPAPATESSPASEPMITLLRPLTVPPDTVELSRTGPVSDDVVLAIQRAIASIGSEPTLASEPAAATPLPPRRGTTLVVEALATRSATESESPPDDTPASDLPAPAALLPEALTGSVAVSGNSTPLSSGDDPLLGLASSDPADERRSALKRLIGGLRRR